jgi:ATP-binding cassette subfamily B multidrug efflux pump
MSYFEQLRPYLRVHRSKLVLGIACIVALNLFKAIGPFVMQKIIDNLSGHFTRIMLLQGSSLLLMLAVLQGAALFVQERMLNGMSRDMVSSLRHDFYRHLQMLPLEFYRVNEAGDLMARATNDLQTAVSGAGQGLISALNALLAVACILPIMMFVNSRLAVVTLVPLLSVGIAWHFLNKKIYARFEAVQSSFSALCNRAYEMLTAVRTIRAYNQERRQVEHFEITNAQYTSHNLQSAQTAGLVYPLLQFWISLSFIAMLWYGGSLISSGKLSIGQFVEFQVYLGYLAWEVPEFTFALDVIMRGAVSMRRVHDVMAVKPAIQTSLGPLEISEIHGAVEFRHLTFKYPDAVHAVLDNINLRIAPGQTVAVVGPVGCGKSTLMHLVARLLDAGPGQILIDGHPITEIPLRTLRSSIGYVPQETFLFSDTIAGNIAFGLDNAGEPEIRRAAIQAGLARDIEQFPRGYNTMVGEKGVTLSGGQRQRISIARAIIRHPKMLLFDDCFSAIDASTESQILQRLEHLRKGCTCMISSHRISTIKGADWIIVLDGGGIAEQGTHNQLLASEGIYASMHRRQLLEQELVIS